MNDQLTNDDWAHRFFDEAWRRLEHESKCDALGGVEYTRVYAEWLAAERPYNVWGFIEMRANDRPWSADGV